MKLLSIILLFVTLICPNNLFGQIRIVSADEIKAVRNPDLVEGKQQIVFASNVLQLGDISEDDKPHLYKFEFTNTGTNSIRLTKVITSCGCTGATFSKESVKAGGKGTIDLLYNPKDQAGTVDGRTFVYTSLSDEKPTAVISLIGEVKPTSDVWNDFPKAMGDLRVKRRSMSFNEVTKTSKQTERLVCGNSGKKPLKLTAFSLPPYASFRTEPEIIKAGAHADIVITIDGSKIGKEGLIKLPVIIQGLSGAPSSRTLSIEINMKK